jgi:hypothetical protein
MAVAALFSAVLATPAGATKPDSSSGLEDGHKITICHATRSLSNPYVEITIDIAAWNDPSDDKNHGDHHTRTKNGFMWMDKVLEEGEECSLTPPGGSCAGEEVDWVAEFTLDPNGSGGWLSLVPWRQTMVSDPVLIPQGTYSVVLGTWDDSVGGEDQPNEKWRADFGSGVESVFSADLGYTEGRPNATDAVSSSGGTVVLESTVTSITAEHWSVDGDVDSINSVNPRCVGLIEQG